MQTGRKSIVPGLVLIIIGGLLLLSRLKPYYFGWSRLYPLLLIALSLLCFFSIRSKKDIGALFPGTILFLTGLFFFLRNYDYIPYYYLDEIWPIFLIIVGLAFVVLFVARPQDWGVLIPGGVLLFFGAVFLMREFDVVYWRTWELIAQYWPLILIFIGSGIILSSLRKRTG